MPQISKCLVFAAAVWASIGICTIKTVVKTAECRWISVMLALVKTSVVCIRFGLRLISTIREENLKKRS